MGFVAQFFAGAFLCNCIPHLIAGVQGQPFPTPFAKPHGVGMSPPWLNFLWGTFNLAVSLWLLRAAPLTLGPGWPWLAFSAGWLLLGLFAAIHFGAVQAGRKGQG